MKKIIAMLLDTIMLLSASGCANMQAQDSYTPIAGLDTAHKDTARITAYTGNRIAYVCQRRVMNFAINKERLTRFGLVSMLDYYTERCVTC